MTTGSFWYDHNYDRYMTTTTDGTGIYITPNSGGNGSTISSPNIGGGVVMSPGESKYQEMELPKEDMPVSVFVAGRMLTLGIIGSDVEAAYMGKNLMMFKPGVINVIQFNSTLTLSIEYKNEIYHYNVTNNLADKIDVGLLSVIQK